MPNNGPNIAPSNPNLDQFQGPQIFPDMKVNPIPYTKEELREMAGAAQMAGNMDLADELWNQHEAVVAAEDKEIKEEADKRKKAYEQMSDDEKRQQYDKELTQAIDDYEARHPQQPDHNLIGMGSVAMGNNGGGNTPPNPPSNGGGENTGGDDGEGDNGNDSEKRGRIGKLWEKIKNNKGISATVAVTFGAAALAMIIAFSAGTDKSQSKSEWLEEYYGEDGVRGAQGLDLPKFNNDIGDHPQDADWYNQYYGRRTVGENDFVHGIIDGYKGLWDSPNKKGGFRFANASEVIKMANGNPNEAIKLMANRMVESFGAYVGSIEGQVQPEEFKGLNINEADDKLESMSAEDYAKSRVNFLNLMDKAKRRPKNVNGRINNSLIAYRTPGDNGKLVGSDDKYFVDNPDVEIKHENVELVKCITNEHNTEITEFYWENEYGEEIGKLDVKVSFIYDEYGNIIDAKGCLQPISPNDDLYEGLKEVDDGDDGGTGGGGTDEGDKEKDTKEKEKDTKEKEKDTKEKEKDTKDDDGKKDTPPIDQTPSYPVNPVLEEKHPEAEIRNNDPDIAKKELNQTETPATTLPQDQANFSAIAEQARNDAIIAEQNQQISAMQAENQNQAATIAESRREAETAEAARLSEAEAAREAELRRAADEAAARAQAEAEKAQAEANKVESANVADEISRSIAQQEANNLAEAERANAEAMSVDDNARDGNSFNNGDFDLVGGN